MHIHNKINFPCAIGYIAPLHGFRILFARLIVFLRNLAAVILHQVTLPEFLIHLPKVPVPDKQVFRQDFKLFDSLPLLGKLFGDLGKRLSQKD